MYGKDFISLHDLTVEQVASLFDLAIRIKANPGRFVDALPQKTMAMVFEKPSLRTRVSFETAMTQFGGHAIYLGPSDISLGKRESVPDIARTLDTMVQVIMARTFSHKSIIQLAENADAPVINALSDKLHPCQALADYLTILERKGRLEGLTLAFVGDGNNVANSLMFGGAKTGVNVRIVCPVGYEPDEAIVEQARTDAAATGVNIEIFNDPFEGVAGADIVYTDVWASMGQEAEKKERAKIFRPYQVNSELMAKADKEAIFMHCLPAHRGDEVTDEVVDSWQSVVFYEAGNRLHAQKAILHALLVGDESI